MLPATCIHQWSNLFTYSTQLSLAWPHCQGTLFPKLFSSRCNKLTLGLVKHPKYTKITNAVPISISSCCTNGIVCELKAPDLEPIVWRDIAHGRTTFTINEIQKTVAAAKLIMLKKPRSGSVCGIQKTHQVFYSIVCGNQK